MRTLLQLHENEVLRIPGSPKSVTAESGDILIEIPFEAYRDKGGLLSRAEDVEAAVQILRVRAYGEQMLRLTMSPTGQQQESTPMLNPETIPETVALTAEESDGIFCIRDANGLKRGIINTVPIPIKPWSDLSNSQEKMLEIQWFPDGKTSVPFKSYDQFAHGKIDSIALGYIEDAGKAQRSLFSFSADAQECFSGTGERFAKMDLSGRTVTLENTDGLGVNSRRTYKNIPFYLSSRPYGLFVHTSYKTHLSFADISTRSAQGMIEDDTLDLFLIGGSNVKQVLYNYCCLTGFSPELPLWSYGIWMSRMTYFTADEVKGIAARLRKEDFPCDVLHLDTGWFEKDWVCEWKFSKTAFPDPAGFMSDLRKDGYRVTLWQTPDISKKSDVAPIAQKNGYIPKLKKTRGAGSDFSNQNLCGNIDFSSPDATRWYKEDLLRPLLEMGAAAIKTDFGENIPMDSEYHSMPAEKLRNLYALLYQKAAYEITSDIHGESEAMVWARAGWAGCQRYPVHWGGDAECSWEGMAGSLRGGLHLGLSGFAYWSHDVPGFHSTPDFMNGIISDELYVRWTQFGVFSSHIRYHGTRQREPYEFPDVADVVRDWFKLRYALIPYILEQAASSQKNGQPLLKALLMDNEKDRACWHIDDQFMFGDSFLVAPVMNDQGLRDVYLPQGQWVNFWTGELVQGYKWLYDVASPLKTMPVFVKRGAKIPFYPDPVSCTDQMDLSKQKSVVIDEGFKGLPICGDLWDCQ